MIWMILNYPTTFHSIMITYCCLHSPAFSPPPLPPAAFFSFALFEELELWDENWQLVYALAEATMARTMTEFMQD